MTIKRLGLGLVLAAGMAWGAENGHKLFQKGLAKERAEGDPRAAIKIYEQVVRENASDHRLAAQALIRLAECSEKLGNAESRKIYERVLREYGDQKEAVTMARERLGGNARPDRPTTTQIGSGPKAGDLGKYAGGVSPDGRYLSFTDSETGDLALYEIATGTDRRLTNANLKKRIFVEGSVISRDGKLIAYYWQEPGKNELRIASVTGDPSPRVLYENPEIDDYELWDWSPDGKWLAVEISRKDHTKQIGLVSIAGGSLRVLKSIDWRGSRGMFFSPDGKYLGYGLPESNTGLNYDIFVLSVEGSRELPAVVHRADDLMMGWSPDGKRLLFASDRSGARDLWGLPISDGKPQGPPELLKADIGRAAESKGVTRSGALFYMTKTGGGPPSGIYVGEYDFANRKRTSDAVEITQEEGLMNRAPTWSPDGKYLAHVSLRVGPGPSKAPDNAGDTLVIRSADTYEVVRQWRGKLRDFYPATLRWIQDSRAVLVKGADLKGRQGIFRIDIETGDVFPVRVDQPGSPAWSLFSLSPDGRKLFYSQGLGRQESNVVERDLISGQEKELMRGGTLQPGRVSPDGRYLAVGRSEASGSTTVVFLPLDGGERREILVPAKVVPDQCWTPDGQSVIVLQPGQGKTSPAYWRVPVDGGSPAKVEDSLVCRVHPDGRRVAYVVAEKVPGKKEIWKLENFLPGSSGAK